LTYAVVDATVTVVVRIIAHLRGVRMHGAVGVVAVQGVVDVSQWRGTVMHGEVAVAEAVAIRIQVVILVGGVLVDLAITVVVPPVAHFRRPRERRLTRLVAIAVNRGVPRSELTGKDG